MPSVSIIMNIRNGASTIREALNSVRAQTYQDWELIVWDDQSVDGGAAIASQYIDERTRYFLSPEDTCLGRARDLALRQANGEWLAFLDQDDAWLPDKLEKQMALVEGDARVGLIYGRTLRFSENGRERDYDHRHEFKPLPEGDIFKDLFTDSCFIAMSSAVIRRSAIDEIGGIPDEIEVTPDYYLYVAVARRYRARAVQEVVCRYRVHGGNMSSSVSCRIHEEMLYVVKMWAENLDSSLVRHRRNVHSTVWAWEEIRRFDINGISRLLTQGSVAYLLSRPFARAFRAFRRHICKPYWMGVGKVSPAKQPTGPPRTENHA